MPEQCAGKPEQVFGYAQEAVTATKFGGKRFVYPSSRSGCARPKALQSTQIGKAKAFAITSSYGFPGAFEGSEGV